MMRKVYSRVPNEPGKAGEIDAIPEKYAVVSVIFFYKFPLLGFVGEMEV